MSIFARSAQGYICWQHYGCERGLDRAHKKSFRPKQSALNRADCGRCCAATCCHPSVVAREGIEPPTPAFSGLRSTTELPGRGDFPVGNSAHEWREMKISDCGFLVSISTVAKTAKRS